MKKQQISNPRLYVLVSNTIDSIYGAVQGGHAVAQWLIDNGTNSNWKNDTVVYLSCNIKKYKKLLDIKHIPHSAWYEPDLENELTSIALVSDGKMFKKLNVLK